MSQTLRVASVLGNDSQINKLSALVLKVTCQGQMQPVLLKPNMI